MFSRVTKLCWWKTDHNETTNEDVCLYDATKGIFVVADGVSTLFFSRRWAALLATYFLDVPLTGDDPFEVEWWLRPLQEQFKEQSPDVNTLHWSVRQKGREGSASTLASVRVTDINDASDKPVTAELLAFGDSCVFIGNEEAQEVRISFPVENVLDFERAPIAIPSLFAKFNRKFHHCLIKRNVPLQAGDILILATDAVAKWILGKGANTRESVWAAFMEVAQKTPSDWSTFISRCRQVRQMVDDDSTALVIRMSKESQEDAPVLGTTPGHNATVLQQRVQHFHNAIKNNDKEALAIFYGDGKDIALVDNPLSPNEIEQAREVADALAEVWQALRSSLSSSSPSQRVQEAWRKNATLLTEEPCAAKLKEALKANGVALNPQKETIASASTVPIHPIAPDHPKSDNPVPAQLDEPDIPPVAASPTLVLTEEEEKLVSALLNVIDAACKNDDDETILFNYNQLPSKYHTSLSQKTRERVTTAQERTKALNTLRAVLRKATAQQMVSTYAEHSTRKGLLPQEQQQLELADKLVHAEKTNDEGAFLSAYKAIQTSDYRAQFIITEEQSLHYHKVRKANSLSLFRSTLRSQPTVEDLFHSYEETKDEIASEITAQERDQVELARTYYAAFAANDPALIAFAYIAAYFSFPSSFFFTQEEEQRREAAINSYPLRPYSGVARVAEHTIHYDHFRKMHITSCLDRFYRNKPSKESALQDEMELLKGQFNDHVLLAETLAFLVRDQQIQNGMKDAKRIGHDLRSFEHEQKTAANGYMTTFRQNTGRNYEKLLKSYHLAKVDVEELFRVFARESAFSKCLSSWGMSSLDEWLRTRESRVTYPEWAAMQEVSTNTDPKRSWIFKWDRWESIPGSGR
jgi:hypothetical protein